MREEYKQTRERKSFQRKKVTEEKVAHRMAERFLVTNEDISSLKKNAYNPNASTKTWMNIYRAWAKSRDNTGTVPFYTGRPDDILRRFYVEIRISTQKSK